MSAAERLKCGTCGKPVKATYLAIKRHSLKHVREKRQKAAATSTTNLGVCK